MYSVTQRISKVKQPYGGYLPIRMFEKFQFQDNVDLYDEENISPSLVGLAVDYLTRCSMGTTVEKAFSIFPPLCTVLLYDIILNKEIK